LTSHSCLYTTIVCDTNEKKTKRTRLNEYVKNIRPDSHKYSVILNHIFEHKHSMDGKMLKF